MPLELQIIRAAEFIRMGPKGEFDMVASCAVLTEFGKGMPDARNGSALLDVRKATAPLAPKEMAALVKTFFTEIGFTQNHRLAILHSGDPYRGRERSRSSAGCGDGKLRAFGDFGRGHGLAFLGKRTNVENTRSHETSSRSRRRC